MSALGPITQDIGWGKRYLLFGGAPRFEEAVSYVKQALEEHESDIAKKLIGNVPTEVEEELQPTVMGPSADKPLLYDCSPAEKELGIQFRSVEEMVTTCVNELLANGFTGSNQYDTTKL